MIVRINLTTSSIILAVLPILFLHYSFVFLPSLTVVVFVTAVPPPSSQQQQQQQQHHHHHQVLLVQRKQKQQEQQQTEKYKSLLVNGPPISIRSGFNKFWKLRWLKATAIAELEQSVEDYNINYISNCRTVAESTRHRRLIVLPLDERFNPPVGVFSHNHIQTGDKVCMPSCFWQSIQLNNAEVPWLFSIQRISGVTTERVQTKQPKITKTIVTVDNNDDDDKNDTEDDYEKTVYEEIEEEIIVSEYKSHQELDQVIAGPLDFRAPSCYIFIPLWMMRSLGLRPRDVVQVDLIETIVPGSLAKLRPHSSDFAKDISNPQAVLETELRHYSSLTAGSTIAFDYNNKKRYWFDVVEVRSAPRGEKQFAIKVQDCDIATDFLPAKDTLKKKKKRIKKKKALEGSVFVA